MMKRRTSCSETSMFCRLILVSILVQFSFGFDLYEDSKRQNLIPLARLGRDRVLTLEEKMQDGILPFPPREHRRIWELHQTLIPYPRAGRMILDPESIDYDIFINADYGSSDDRLAEALRSNLPVVQKKAVNVKLIPRIGRKKRSAPEEHAEQSTSDKSHETSQKDGRSSWDDEFEPDFFVRSDRQVLRRKSAFIPRVGKKRSEEIDDNEYKRAMAFTPRIGRAKLIPRIGRNDPRFRLMSRGAFVPRIGRRAALIPRIGRSEPQQAENEENN